MPALVDLTGRTFGRLTVISRAENASNGAARWNCVCTCGCEAVTSGSHLTTGHSTSCGCRQRDRASEANTKPDHEISYFAAHARIRRTRGPASEYFCIDCGSAAIDWSLRRDTPGVFTGEANGYSLSFSADPGDYDPRCRDCHYAYDRE